MIELTRRHAIGAAFAAAAARPILLRANGDRPVSVLLYGNEDPLPRQIPLQAGPLRLIFEPELAQLRYVRAGDREIVRAVYAAVRDQNWNTITPHISNLRMETTDGAFALQFDITCREGPIDFLWKGTVRGDVSGTVKYDFDGTARSTFKRNRLGFCVLHPETCAGQPVTVGKASGSTEAGRFPVGISPHQPFLDIRSLRHSVQPGLEAEVLMQGDVFEMEDQRNWTDASYKTYCTPLGLPFPVEVKQGTRVQQSVTIRLVGTAPHVAGGLRSPEVSIEADEKRVSPLPLIGLGVASHGEPLTEREIQRLRALRPAHLRVDVDFVSQNWQSDFARAASEARALGTALEVALKLGGSPESELDRFASALRTHKPRVSRYLVFHKDEKSTSGKWMEVARRAIRAADPGAMLASGSNAYFTELNRGRPPLEQSDLVCYSINPQVHAFDNASLVETLAMQGETLRSARRFCGSLPLAVTPVTLKPRFNPNATSAPAAAAGPLTSLPDEVDARQMSLFAAAWTLGSLKYLAENGAASATFYETTGWRGVMETEKGSPLPKQFRSQPGEVFPLYHVLADAAAFAGGEVVAMRSADPMRAEALLLRSGRRRRLLVANLTPELQHVRIRAGVPRTVRATTLDRHSAATAASRPERFRPGGGTLQELPPGGVLPVSLLPYAYTRIDFTV